jgi:hypothetical protein
MRHGDRVSATLANQNWEAGAEISGEVNAPSLPRAGELGRFVGHITMDTRSR